MSQVILWSGVESKNKNHLIVRTGGVYQLASWLRQQGYTVTVIDFCFMLSTDDIIDMTTKYIGRDTIAIGVSSTFWEITKIERDGIFVGGAFEPDWLVAARTRIESSFPNIKWLIGGANSHIKSVFKWVRFKDHAEDSLIKWLDENTNTKVSRNAFDIGSCCKLHHASDFIQPQEVLSVELGRGCIFKCKFCTSHLLGKKAGTYTRSFDDIRNEIMDNYNKYGVTKYYFTDDTVNDSVDKVESILKLSKSLPFELEWQGYCRADLIWSNFETADMLAESGLKSPFFGIETFNPVSSRAISKGWSGKHGKEFLLKLKEHWKDRLTWHLGLIIGCPGWNREELENDITWLTDNDMHSWVWWALYINPKGGYQQSVFELDYAKYGYTFEGNNMVSWINGDMRHEELRHVAIDANARTYDSLKVAGFRLGELSGNLNCSMSSLLNVYEKDLDWNAANQGAAKFLENYKNNHLNS